MFKKRIKEFIGVFIRFSGLLLLIRSIFLKNKVLIIFYHKPKASVLKKHIEYLSKHYNFIPLARLIEAIYEKNWAIIPKRSLIITIDDGHKGNYKLLNIFKSYKIKPTIYLCSHIINTKRKFWWMAGVPNYIELKKLQNSQRLQILEENYNFEPSKEYSTRQSMSLEEIKEMSPYIDFQNHSKFHPILTTCSDKECRDEIKSSKEYLEKKLDKKIEHFSYPNGDYTQREINILKECGYKSARTFDLGWNDIHTDPFKLKAMGVDDGASLNILSAQLFGFFRFFRYIKHFSFKGFHPPYT
ncbi:MAG: polysaccharide deacetylase family protein [Candidatus Helarchaeota archaeon]